MSDKYEYEVKFNKKFKGNVVILLRGKYYSIREPDSGLTVPEIQRRAVVSLTLNPTTVDFKRASQTIASYSFRLLDKALVITTELAGLSTLFMGEEVRVWLGRSGVNMPFSDYLELPKTTITKLTHSDNSYSFACKDATETMVKEVYNVATITQAAVTNLTTAFQVTTTAGYQTSGLLKIEDEIVSYTTKTATQFQGITRGMYGTVPVAHDFGEDIVEVFRVTGNPIDIILKIWTSTGSGTNGAYDTLPKGLGIDSSLIDIAELEQLRADYFPSDVFTLYLYDIDNTLRFMEEELFQASGTRMITNRAQKISLTVLDQARFDMASENPIGETSIDEYPKWDVELKDVVSTIVINYDFDEISQKYLYTKIFENQETIDIYGKLKPLTFSFKGVREASGGASFINSLGQRLLARFSTVRPEIEISTHVDKSILSVGDKVFVTSSQLPTGNGTLNFAESMEIVSRAFDPITATVKFKLQFTSYTGIRGAYIAPTTPVALVLSQNAVEFPAGRADNYEVGWRLRLWNRPSFSYEPDPVNIVKAIDGDIVYFEEPFSTAIDADVHEFRFADYDQVVESQKKYGFISRNGSMNFDDGTTPYKIGI